MNAPQYSTALIVGAGSGLSASLARLFAREGLRVALAARQIDKLAELCREAGARAFACDASNSNEVKRLFDNVEGDIGAPDVVVYDASARARGPLLELVAADVERTIAVSAFGAFLVAQQAVQRMLPKNHGAVLFTSASASVKGYAQSAPFARESLRYAGWRKAWRASLRRKASMSHISSSTEPSEIRAESNRPTNPNRCLIPMPLRQAIFTCCGSHAPRGHPKSSSGLGSKNSDGQP